jgi:uncharacterized protein YukE
MIQIPIEIGDTILTGKFRNKKVTVKEIGKDEHGSPTVNGKTILKIRIAKLMNQEKDSKKEGKMSKLDSMILKIINEERQNLHELEITDIDLIREAKRMAEISDRMDAIKAELERLQNEFQPLTDKFIPLMEQASETGDRALELEDILITIKKRGYRGTSVGYKEAFLQLYNKVNKKMKEQADAILTANTSMKTVATSLAVQRRQTESKINESGFLQKIYDKVKSFISSKLQFLQRNGQEIDNDLLKMKQMVGK